MAEREIMTVDEVAAYLHVHPSTIYRLLKQHKLPAFRMGSDWRFARSAVEQWMKERTQTDVAEGARTPARTSARRINRSRPE
jgi:excisionase family DNA binding protein